MKIWVYFVFENISFLVYYKLKIYLISLPVCFHFKKGFWSTEINFIFIIIFAVWMVVSRPTIRLLQSTQGQTCNEYHYYFTLVGLCSKLLMRLSYYIFLELGNCFCLACESNSGPSNRESSTLPLDQSANSIMEYILLLLWIFVTSSFYKSTKY